MQDTNPGRRVDLNVWQLEKPVTNMCSFVSTLCSSIMPGPDEPYRSLTIIAVTCWHTVNGSVQSFVSGLAGTEGYANTLNWALYEWEFKVMSLCMQPPANPGPRAW